MTELAVEKNEPQKKVLQSLLAFVVVCKLYAFPVLIHGLCITGLGFWSLPLEFLFLPILLLPIVCPIIASKNKKNKNRGNVAILTVIYTLLALIPAVFITFKIRHVGFLLATYRAQPLIDAIEEYKIENGAFPQSLEQVIPKYIYSMPYGTPPLSYALTKPEDKECPWSLHADTPTGFLNFDGFVYYPDPSCYKTRLNVGNEGERIGGWIYIHE